MSKENDQKKIEFLRQALERIAFRPAREWSVVEWAKQALETYQEICLELDAERVQSGPAIIFEPVSEPSAEQLSMDWPGKRKEDHE